MTEGGFAFIGIASACDPVTQPLNAMIVAPSLRKTLPKRETIRRGLRNSLVKNQAENRQQKGTDQGWISNAGEWEFEFYHVGHSQSKGL